MRYQIQKKEDSLELSGLSDVGLVNDAQVYFVLSHTVNRDTVVYSTDDVAPLSDCMKSISEEDFLLYVYSLAKGLEITRSRYGERLSFVLDLQFLFCKEKRVFGIFVPGQDQTETDLKNFFWNLIFLTSFQEKELPVAREFLDFIRTARTIEPQDVLMFIEMGTKGRTITSIYNDLHTGYRETDRNTEDAQKSVQSENDYSSFLSEFDMPMDEEVDESESNADLKEQKQPVSDSIEQSNVDFLMNFDFSTESSDIPGRMDFSDVSPELLEEVQKTDPQLLRDALKEILHGPAEDELEQAEIQEADFLLSSQEEAPDSGDILLQEFPYTEISNSESAQADGDEKPRNLSTEVIHENNLQASKDGLENDAFDWLVSDSPIGGEELTDNSSVELPQERMSDEDVPHKLEPIAVNLSQSNLNKLSVPSDNDGSEPMVFVQQPIEKQKPQEQVQHFTIPIGGAQEAIETRTVKKHFVLVSADGKKIPINKDVFVVGRLTQGVDLTVSDVFVSRTHAQFVKNENGVSLLDLHPKNPSFLNEKAIEPGKAYLLHDSDRIRFGKNTFYFRCEKE